MYLNKKDSRKAVLFQKSGIHFYKAIMFSRKNTFSECGFLSNYKEAELLITEDYQNKMAEAICAGLVKYLDNTESDE